MRVAAVALSILLLSACARPGGEASMTPHETSPATPVDHASDEASTHDDTTTVAAEDGLASVRDIRTATFALG